MEQLIVGVLLFTPLLALLPTTVIWYFYATLLYGMLGAVRYIITLTSRTLECNPLYLMARRAATPTLFPGELPGAGDFQGQRRHTTCVPVNKWAFV